MKRFRGLLLLAVSPLSFVLLAMSVPLAFGSSPVHGQAERVARPWRPGMPQWGVQLYWRDNLALSTSYLTGQAWTQARYLIGLHANSVAVSFPFYTGTITSDEIRPGPATPTPARLGQVLQVFEQAGLRTTIRPILDEQSLGGSPHWRGTITPANRNLWFANYKTFLTPYLDVARQYHVATFAIGTELDSLEGDWHWKGVADLAAKHFRGEISYDANWDSFVRGPIAVPVSHLGVDAYFPVNVPDSASVRQLVGGLNTWLDKRGAAPAPRTVVSEAGIAASNGAYRVPYASLPDRPLNPQVQANWYAAVCDVVHQHQMGGVYWWAVSLTDNPFAPPGPHASSLDFAGRPRTERAIRACFTGSQH
jgi:hypothetical protein